ncbi:transcriptional regulator GcvA [Limimaricola variabilis]|uniref:transcriptional regulator GcvA n=1 Tax=Limimaricola variabilis TaxID=1492771 RepID=UPI002AC9858C|nr:transcriptional regulator GcvA [Limimaricola variabilis]WPY93240.1 transcriptional regulator GcvA [Limimaricola variabilis]
MARKKNTPPLNWLRSFEAAARLMSFTRAAAELNMTQAAISQQIKGLEAHLGASLFNRLPRSLELTETGKAYLPAVHEAMERLAAATNEIFGEGRGRLLTVRVNLVFFTRWLAPRLARFRDRHPDIGLRFNSNIWLTEHEKVAAQLDIRYGKGNWPGLDADRLTWDSLMPVCSPELARGVAAQSMDEALTVNTLLHVIGYEEGWGYWLRRAGFTHLDASHGMQFDTLITALEMAERGHGIALGRTSLVAGALAEGGLVAPFDVEAPTSEAFYVVSARGQYQPPQARAFRDWLVEEAAAG